MIDYLDPTLIYSRFNSLLASGKCTLMSRAEWAWQSWIKIVTYGAREIKECIANNNNFDVRSTYLLFQVAHIYCKKDNHQILFDTVSQ
jgi:hypothetical protein